MSSKENSPAIGSFLWVVMLIMIMKPHLRSMWEENIEDLVRGKFPNSMVLMNQKFHFRRCRPIISFKIASFRLHPIWGTNSDDPVVTITEVLPLPPSRIIGNVGVSTGARQPSLAKILSQIDAYLWLYNDDCGRQPSYIKYKTSMICLFWLRCDHLSVESGPSSASTPL